MKRLPGQYTLVKYQHLRATARAFILMSAKRKARFRCRQDTVRAIPTEGGGAWLICPLCKWTGVFETIPN